MDKIKLAYQAVDTARNAGLLGKKFADLQTKIRDEKKEKKKKKKKQKYAHQSQQHQDEYGRPGIDSDGSSQFPVAYGGTSAPQGYYPSQPQYQESYYSQQEPYGNGYQTAPVQQVEEYSHVPYGYGQQTYKGKPRESPGGYYPPPPTLPQEAYPHGTRSKRPEHQRHADHGHQPPQATRGSYPPPPAMPPDAYYHGSA